MYILNLLNLENIEGLEVIILGLAGLVSRLILTGGDRGIRYSILRF